MSADSRKRRLPGRAASVASLKRRLEAAADGNKQLRRRVAELEAQLAIFYGQLRARQQTEPGTSMSTR
jgi:hypothetical protein